MRSVGIIFKSLYACQHQCGFCHVLHVPRNTSYMSTEEVKATFDVIEQKYAGCVVSLDMSGGEFAMRKDAVELLQYLRTKRIHFSSLVLDTMAVPLAKEELARALGELFTAANVSVHAADPEVHAQVSASKTDFEDLRAGLVNLFRYFPSVFTNTSINKFNYDRLRDIAKFVLKARKASGRETPLYCAYYLPVYRAYGESKKENHRRLQDVDNTQFLPPGDRLEEIAVEFERTSALLAMHGGVAQLRDFNYPACVYRRVTGTYPENAYGLPNFMHDSYFTDYNHPMERGYTLEEVYPSMYGRVKDEACGSCVVEAVCPGITSEWRKRGYEVRPVDVDEYARGFPELLLRKSLQSVLLDSAESNALFASVDIDWNAVQMALFARLSGGASDIREARTNVLSHSMAERARALCDVLRATNMAVADQFEAELTRLEKIEQDGLRDVSLSLDGEGLTPAAEQESVPARSVRRLPLVV